MLVYTISRQSTTAGSSSLGSISLSLRRSSATLSFRNNMSSGSITTFDQLDADIQHLIREAVSARQSSYSPYSNFKVGSAVRCLDGTVRSGCNVENASFGVSLCAERCAMVKAISEKHLKFTALSVVAEKIEGRLTTPCGACRQMLREFGDYPVYIACPDMREVLVTSCVELLPYAFEPGNRLHSSK